MRTKQLIPKRKEPLPVPSLRFSPTAWAQLRFLRDTGPTEIGGFGISPCDDLLRIEEVVLVRQEATAVTVAFDDVAVAEFFDDQVATGRRPAEFGRVWIHTHPGDSPQPSPTDEETFQRVFGSCDWAVMCILARSGATYARLQWNVGPQGAIELPVTVDYSRPFRATDEAAWQAAYDRCVVPSVHEPFEAIDADLWEWWRADPLDLFPFPSERSRHAFESI